MNNTMKYNTETNTKIKLHMNSNLKVGMVFAFCIAIIFVTRTNIFATEPTNTPIISETPTPTPMESVNPSETPIPTTTLTPTITPTTKVEENPTTTPTQTPNPNVRVGSNTFNVKIPKTIIMNGIADENGINKGNYVIEFSSDTSIGENEVIKILPDEQFVLRQEGKTDILVEIEQDKIEWKNNEFDIVANGELFTENLSAGVWHGNFNFNFILETIDNGQNISLEDELTPTPTPSVTPIISETPTPTPIENITPTIQPSNDIEDKNIEPTPTPSESVSPTPIEPTPSVTPIVSETPTPTPTPTPTETVSQIYLEDDELIPTISPTPIEPTPTTSVDENIEN